MQSQQVAAAAVSVIHLFPSPPLSPLSPICLLYNVALYLLSHRHIASRDLLGVTGTYHRRTRRTTALLSRQTGQELSEKQVSRIPLDCVCRTHPTVCEVVPFSSRFVGRRTPDSRSRTHTRTAMVRISCSSHLYRRCLQTLFLPRKRKARYAR